MPIHWCCQVFRINFMAAGERGFGVFVVSEEDQHPSFVFQHRSLDPGATIPTTSTPVGIVGDAVIHYCPWCGANLEKHYKRHYKELDRSDLRVRT